MHARVDGPGKDTGAYEVEIRHRAAPIVAGGQPFGPEAHRYQLSSTDRDPSTSEPVAIYKHGGRVPDNA